MAGKKGKSGGHGINAGRHKKERKRFKFQIMAFAETIKAVKELKAHCKSEKMDFVDELNKRIGDAMTIGDKAEFLNN